MKTKTITFQMPEDAPFNLGAVRDYRIMLFIAGLMNASAPSYKDGATLKEGGTGPFDMLTYLRTFPAKELLALQFELMDWRKATLDGIELLLEQAATLMAREEVKERGVEQDEYATECVAWLTEPEAAGREAYYAGRGE